MKSSDVNKLIKEVQLAFKKNSPQILTGIGIAGMVTTAVMAVRATPKAMALIEERENKWYQDHLGDVETSYKAVPKIELVKAAWTCYIPSVIVGGVSIACLIGANNVNLRRNAALATAYSLSESALKEYQEKVIEEVGAKKETEIRDKIAKDRIDRNPVTRNEVVLTEKGETLCYDMISGRYFKTDIDKLRKAENDLNRQMRDDIYISLNEFYDAIDLDPVKIGENIGWNIDKGYIDLSFSSQLTEDGRPCLVLDYKVGPNYDYKW